MYFFFSVFFFLFVFSFFKIVKFKIYETLYKNSRKLLTIWMFILLNSLIWLALLSHDYAQIPYWYSMSRLLHFVIFARQYFAGFYFRDSNWKIRKKGIKIRDSSVLNFTEVLKSSRYTETSKTYMYFFFCTNLAIQLKDS